MAGGSADTGGATAVLDDGVSNRRWTIGAASPPGIGGVTMVIGVIGVIGVSGAGGSPLRWSVVVPAVGRLLSAVTRWTVARTSPVRRDPEGLVPGSEDHAELPPPARGDGATGDHAAEAGAVGISGAEGVCPSPVPRSSSAPAD
jgi:hypothetical protein